MSRLINLESAGKERNHLARTVVLAVRELANLSGPCDEARDLVAYITITLMRIAATIDVSVAAWEKRGYWVKADRFRMEWQWANDHSRQLKDAIASEQWGTIAIIAARTAEKLNTITIPKGHHMGRPWLGVRNIDLAETER